MDNRASYKEQFEQIYTENYSRLYYYALHIVDDEEVCRDLINDVFMGLWKVFERIDGKHLNAYLLTSIRNKAVDHLRHSVQQTRYSEAYLHEVDIFYQQGTGYSEDTDRLVERMFDQLSPPTDEILRLCYLERMKYAEVAERLGISPHTVKKHVMKALKILREHYKDTTREEADGG